MKFQKFSPKQRLAMTWWMEKEHRDKDGILCDGAVRSGKTVCLTVGFLLWSMAKFENCTFALCGKTIESLRRNVVSLIPQWTEGIFRMEEKRSENRITVYSGDRKNDYYLFGGKDESSFALIQGITLAGVLLDEVALMPRSFVEQAIARCSVKGSKFWFNCNPAGRSHWFFQEWVEKSEERHVLHLHFTMEDNPSLDPKVRRRYERLYTGAFYDRYVRGLWRSAEGAVYECFDEQRHMTAKLPPMVGDSYVSIDYGTLNPTVFLKWQHDSQGIWYCTDEYYWSGRSSRCQKTDGEYGADLERFVGDTPPRAVIVDPSASSFIAELRRRGFRVQRADNRVLDGIRFTSGLLSRGRLRFSTKCVRTKDEFESYVWDETAIQRGEDRPMKEHDHCMDAMRYFAMTVLARGSARAGKRPRGM